MCNCKYLEAVFALLILIFSFVSTAYSKWVIVISALVLLIHSVSCNCHTVCKTESKPKAKRRR